MSTLDPDGTRLRTRGDGARSGRLETRAPMHLEATVRVLQRRPTNLVDVWADGRYWRVLGAPGARVLAVVENRGTIDAPDLRYTLHPAGAPASRAASLATLRRVLGLDVDPAPLARVAEATRALRPTARALRGMRPPRFPELFETFANVVPFQQVSLDAGVAVVRRLVERLGDALEHDGLRFHAFPAAATVAEARLETLRRCGLSAHKAAALRAIARSIADGALDEATLARLSTPEARVRLAELPGIGPWSASLVLLRGLGRLDVFPPGDVGVARGLGALLRRAPGATLDRLVARAGDRRGYLYFQSLGGALLARGLIAAAAP